MRAASSVTQASQIGEIRPAEFAPGQIWSIKSDSPATAKINIGRVEPFGRQVR
jgi:hypothetical protein